MPVILLILFLSQFALAQQPACQFATVVERVRPTRAVFENAIPHEPNSLGSARPELDQWVMSRLEAAYEGDTFQFLGVTPQMTKQEAFGKLQAKLTQFFGDIDAEITRLKDELHRDRKSEDITDPRFVFMRELEGVVRQHDYLKTLVPNLKDQLPPGVHFSTRKQRDLDAIHQFLADGPDKPLSRDDRVETIYHHFHFLKTTWSELGVFVRVENGLHAASNAYQLLGKSTLELNETAIRAGLDPEFDVIGMKTVPLTVPGSPPPQPGQRPLVGHTIIVGEVKAVNGPLGLHYGDGSSVVENLIAKRTKARKVFDYAIEYRVYSPTGFTPELAAELTKKGFVLRPAPAP